MSKAKVAGAAPGAVEAGGLMARALWAALAALAVVAVSAPLWTLAAAVMGA